MSIHIRTKIRYDYSYITHAVLCIGEETLEVASFGDYALNQIENADLDGIVLSGYPINHMQLNDKQHIFDVVLGYNEYITLSTFKDLVSVIVLALWVPIREISWPVMELTQPF